MHVHSFSYADTLRSGKVLYDEGYEPLDGDWPKVAIIDPPDDGGSRILGPQLNCGCPVDPTHVPTAFRYKAPRHQGLRDFMPFLRGTSLVSPRLREIVERHEPGRHQFLPVRMMRKDTFLGDMAILIVAVRLDGLAHPLCRPPREGRPVYMYPPGGGGMQLVFDPDRIAGHHLWVEKHVGHRFMSDTLAAALEAAGIEGLKIGAPYPVARP